MHSDQTLYNETSVTLTQINQQIAVVKKKAEQNNIPVHLMQNRDGSLVLTPLLLAQSLCLSTLATLKVAKKAEIQRSRK